MPVLYDYLKEFLLSYGFMTRMAVYGAALISFTILIIAAMIVFLIVRQVLVKIVGRIVRRSKGIWAESLFEHKVFHVLTHMIPAIIIFSSNGFGGTDIAWLPSLIKGLAHIYLASVIMAAFIRVLNSGQEIYNTYPYSKHRPIKGYIQVMKIVVYFVGAIFILAILVDKNPATLFAGLGAMAAVLLFIFKDPILGFVASIQLAANNMLKPGDWITIPKFNVDGIVHDISLTTVKVQNWDKTITTVPTYSLVAESVTNWIGMTESGGRRIKRTVNIDLTSIRLCDPQMLERIHRLPFFNEFIVPDSPADHDDYQDDSNVGFVKINLFDTPTNLSLFKKYLEGYCRAHQGIHEHMTRMVRLLQSGDNGLPVEVIVFSKAQQSIFYEALQTEIFDHIFAILPEFGLRVFQNPSAN